MTKDDLRQLFSCCGTVLNTHVAVDKQTNKPRGFGFVDFATNEEAQNAVRTFDKYPLENKFLSVSIKI